MTTVSIYENINEDEKNQRSMDPDYAWDQIKASQNFLEPPIKWIPPPMPTPIGVSSKTKEQPRLPPKAKDFFRFVFISDTHGKHRDLPVRYLPRGDVLVHAGDLTNTGEPGTIEDISRYFREYVTAGGQTKTSTFQSPNASGTITAKAVCVAGNHDLTLDRDWYDQNWHRFHFKNENRNDQYWHKFQHKNEIKIVGPNAVIRRDAIYLHDESHLLEFPTDPTTGDNNDDADHNANANPVIHIWGSPYSPKFFGWAFNKERGPEIRESWDKIPSREGDRCNSNNTNGSNNDNHRKHQEESHRNIPVDVLITHGPPLGRGDLVFPRGPRKPPIRAGCYDLLEAIQDRVKPRINVFGHIHEGSGVTYDGTTLYINASTVNEHYETINLPIVVDLPFDSTASARVVQPSSLFHNHNTNIASLEEWIDWCLQHDHEFVAGALYDLSEQNVIKTNDWFGGADADSAEPPPDRLFETLAGMLGYWFHLKRVREARRELAKMVYHLYAEAFETFDTAKYQI